MEWYIDIFLTSLFYRSYDKSMNDEYLIHRINYWLPWDCATYED